MAYIGYIDSISVAEVRGWLIDTGQPESQITFDLFVSGFYQGQHTAGFYRQDLAERGLGNGAHGFIVPLMKVSSRIPLFEEIEFCVRATKRRWLQSAQGRLFETQSKQNRRAANEYFLQKLYHSSLQSLRALSGSQAEIGPGPFLQQLSSPVVNKESGRNFEDSSKLAAFLRSKYSISPDRFTSWYLNDFVAKLPREITLLLSIDEIGLTSLKSHGPSWRQDQKSVVLRIIVFLRGLVGDNSDIDCISVFDFLIKSRFLSDDISAIAWGAKAIWSSRLSFVEYGLTRYIALFSRVNNFRSRNVIFFKRNRDDVYFFLMLYLVGNPSLRHFIPKEGLRSMLDNEHGPAPFEKIATRRFGTVETGLADTYRAYLKSSLPYLPKDFTSNYGLRKRPVRVQMIGPHSRLLGLGESCRRLATILKQLEPEIVLVDYDLGNGSEVFDSVVYEREIQCADITIIHLNAEEVPEFILKHGKAVDGSYIVLIPYWELSEIAEVHRLGCEMVDEIWATTSFIAKAFQDACQNTHQIGMPPKRLQIGEECAVDFTGGHKESFLFLTSFDSLSWLRRKNAIAAVKAFKLAFPYSEDVHLIIKTQNMEKITDIDQINMVNQLVDACRSDKRITLISDSFSRDQQNQLMLSCDCLVSLHRAEGLGLDLLDAVSNGIPLVSTAYSGNMDFCTEANTLFVDYELVKVQVGEYPFVNTDHVWAEPSISSAAFAMRSAKEARYERSERATAGVAFEELENAVRFKLRERFDVIGCLIPEVLGD